MARPPIHPGVHIRIEMVETNTSPDELSRMLDIPKSHVLQLINEERGVTESMASRLASWLGTTPGYWIELQRLYEQRIKKG